MTAPKQNITPSRILTTYQALYGTEITDEVLAECATLFSNNYGVWGAKAINISRYTKPGQRVKMTASRLRAQCVSDPEKTVLVRCFKGESLVGHAFATIWEYEEGVVGWVTQLVVDLNVRKQYIATVLLQILKSVPLFHNVTVVGLVSSHPAACTALAKYARAKIGSIDTDFIRANAEKVLKASSIGYLKAAKLRGSLFQAEPDAGVVSSIDTEFYVDHKEPLDVLEDFKRNGIWCLGELLDGHEYLILVPTMAPPPFPTTSSPSPTNVST